MEHTKLALSAVMIVAVGLIGTNLVTGLEMTNQEKLDANQDLGSIYGHVTAIHSDSDGNILSYVQTDNLVANEGKDCMAELIFASAGGANCESAVSAKYSTIALYDGTSFPATMNVSLANGLLTNDVEEGSFTGLGFVQGTVTEDTVATGDDYVDGSGSITSITNTFTASTGVSGKNIDGAALLDDNSPPQSVLAGQQFTAVSLTDGDTLAITWLITLG